jgi:hypothetical protein
MLWWSLGPHIEQRVNQETEQRWGWVVFPPPEEQYPGFGNSLTLGAEYMPRTGITNETALEVHGRFKLLYPGVHKHLSFPNPHERYSFAYGFCYLYFFIEWRDSDGKWRYVAWIGEPDEAPPWAVSWYGEWKEPSELDSSPIDWEYSYRVSSSYVDAVRHMEPWRGSTVGPTHTVESRFTDTWKHLEPIEVTITFGPHLTLTINDEWASQWAGDPWYDEGYWKGLVPTPDSTFNIEHAADRGLAGDADTYPDLTKFAELSINSSTVPWDFTALKQLYWTKGGDHWWIGNGSALEWWCKVESLSISGNFNGRTLGVPRILDLTERGLTTWGKTSPDDNRYGDVLLWLWDGYATCPEWQLGNHGDPMNVLPTWYGPEWDGDAGEWIEMRNPLDGICPYCGSRMRPQGMNKVPWLDGWPYAEQTDWIPDPEDPEAKTEFADGTAAPLTQSQLHAVFKPYAQRLAPYAAWDKKAEYVSDDYELWWGASALLVDRKSGIANTLPTSITQAAVPVIPLHVEDLTATDRVSSPFFNVADANTEVDVDLGPAGERVSAWESTDFTVINGGIGTTLPVAWTVGAGGGTLERGPLINPYWERNAYLIANEQAGAYPYAYMYRKAGASPPGLADYVWPGGWDDRDCMGGDHAGVDVTSWSSHRQLVIDLTPDAATSMWDSIKPSLRLTYNTATVEDNLYNQFSYVGAGAPSKDVTVTKSDDVTLTVEGEWLTENGTPTSQLVFDIWKDTRGNLEHVSKVELIFPAAAAGIDFEMDGLALQEPSYGLITHHEPHHAYSWGGTRAVVDGVTDGLYAQIGSQQQAKIWNSEAGELLVPHVNESYSWSEADGTQDVSTAWGMETYLAVLASVGEGWPFQVPDNWLARTRDADGAIFTIGYSFDIAEYQLQAAQAAFAGWLHSGVAGIGYKPWGTLCVQGGLHGFADDTDRLNYVSIYHKPEGMPETNWLIHKYASVDGYAYWATGDDIVYAYNDTTPVFWNYRVGKKGTPIPRLYERQWVHRYYESSLDRFDGGINAMRDPWDIIWEAYTIGGNVYVRRLNRQLLSWGPSVLVASVGNDASQPSISRNHSGLLYVSVLAGSESNPITFYSDDVGRTWVQFDAGNNDNGDDDNGNGDDG